MEAEVQSIICDPQTSGGLLIMVSSSAQSEFDQMMQDAGFKLDAIGKIIKPDSNTALVQINV
jgi:selenide,water dikinase